jgi:hypothetical protein
LAEDRGPDIFRSKAPAEEIPNQARSASGKNLMVYPVTSSGIKKEVTYQKREEKTWTSKDVRNLFVDVVAKDVILDDGKIYGLPLSVDTWQCITIRTCLITPASAKFRPIGTGNFSKTLKN